jgi:hypothetical protein
MKKVDLGLASPSLAQLLAMAQDESIMLIAGDGNSFILEHADDFDREVQQLGESEKFMTFLDERSKEKSAVSIEQLANRLNSAEE